MVQQIKITQTSNADMNIGIPKNCHNSSNNSDTKKITMAQQTAVEKAEELVRKFKPFVQFKMGVEQSYVLRMAKQCALVAVDEIIKTLNYDIKDLDVRGNILLDLIKYWREVKQEIEKI